MQVGLLVEDHHDAAEWLGQVVHSAFPDIRLSVVDSLGPARTTLAQLCGMGFHPDLALVDLGLPDGSGVELIAELRSRAPKCVCVVASRFEDDDHLFSALRAGASGYLLKQRPQEELTRLLQGIVRGEPPVAPALVSRLLAVFGPGGHSGPEEDAPSLTAREREVLVLLAQGDTLTRIGDKLGVSRHTVAEHVKHIYAKLEVSSRAGATLKAVRMGVVSP